MKNLHSNGSVKSCWSPSAAVAWWTFQGNDTSMFLKSCQNCEWKRCSFITDSSTPRKTQNERVLQSWGLSAGAPSHLCSLEDAEISSSMEIIQQKSQLQTPQSGNSRSHAWNSPGSARCSWYLTVHPDILGDQTGINICTYIIFISLGTRPLFLCFKLRKQCHKKKFSFQRNAVIGGSD